MVGRLIEGKGKPLETFPRASIVSYEKTRNKKGAVTGYIMRLQDGRSFMMLFARRAWNDGDPLVTIMDRFLTQKREGRVL